MTGPPDATPAPRHVTARLLAIALVVLAADQLTKMLIVGAFEIGESARVLGPLLSLTRRTNTGGAFGMLSGSTRELAIVSTVVMVALLCLAPRLAGHNRATLAGIGLVVGGAAGNLLDRVRLGHVVDFIDFHKWPVFNIADAAISIGAAVIIIAVLLEARARPPEES